jgi:hypothetical protein
LPPAEGTQLLGSRSRPVLSAFSSGELRVLRIGEHLGERLLFGQLRVAAPDLGGEPLKLGERVGAVFVILIVVVVIERSALLRDLPKMPDGLAFGVGRALSSLRMWAVNARDAARSLIASSFCNSTARAA